MAKKNLKIYLNLQKKEKEKEDDNESVNSDHSYVNEK